MAAGRAWIWLNRAALSFFALAHVLFGKPVPTFPGHALKNKTHGAELAQLLRIENGAALVNA